MNLASRPLAIPYEQPRVQYILTLNPQVIFAIPWKFWTLNADLAAVYADSFGNQTELVWGTDFTVIGNTPADPTQSYYDGGNIILAQQWLNGTLTLWRLPTLQRNYDISPTGPLDVRTLNAQLDRITTTLQDLQLEINAGYPRSYVDLGNTFPVLNMPEPEDGMVLGWTGDELSNIENASGPQGPQGETGETGATGPMGPQGIQGESGQSAVIVGGFGFQTTPADLPPSGLLPPNWDGPGYPGGPYQMQLGMALLYNRCPPGTPGYGNLWSYVTTAEVPAGWLDVGPVVGPPGAQGPQGPQGEPGTEGWLPRTFRYLTGTGASPGPTDIGTYYHMVVPGGFVTFTLPDINIVGNGYWLEVLNDYSSASSVFVQCVAGQSIQWAFGGGNLVQLLAGMRLKLIANSLLQTWTVEDPNSITMDASINNPQPVGSFVSLVRGYAPGNFVVTTSPVGNNGGTFTGSLIVTADGTILPQLILNGLSSGTAAPWLQGRIANVPRWAIVLGGGATEAGNNTGSDLYIMRYSDAGAYIDTPLEIIRSTGSAVLHAGATISADGANVAQLTLNSITPAGGAWMEGRYNNVPRWDVILCDGTLETGGNTGNDFAIYRYSDAGTYLDRPLFISRSSGAVNITTPNQGLTLNAIGNALNGWTGLTLNATGLAGAGNFISSSVGGNARWEIDLGDGAPEGGANSGSDFGIYRRNDAGNNPVPGEALILISRATGVVTFAYPIVNPSNIQLKENLAPIDDALGKVLRLAGLGFNHIGRDKREIGFIAEDVLPIVPEVVYEIPPPFDREGKVKKDDGPYLGIAYAQLTALLVEAIKELTARVQALEGVEV